MVLSVELKKNILLEACVETLDEALLAQKKGADRVEICSRLDLDGVTPNDSFVKNCINNLSIPIKVMVRPRAGNFVYSENELLNIQQKIIHYQSLGVGEVVFGVSYKADISDTRESPALDIIHLLKTKSAKVEYNDPHVDKIELADEILSSTPITTTSLQNYDCCVIATDHSTYDWNMIVKNSQLVIDTRNATKNIVSEKVIKL